MDRQLRRDFRRWNRSRSKYEKAVRAYQFKETKKNYQELAKNFLPKFGITIKELKEARGGQSILKDLNTWFEHSQTQDVQQIVQDPAVAEDAVPEEEEAGGNDLAPVETESKKTNWSKLKKHTKNVGRKIRRSGARITNWARRSRERRRTQVESVPETETGTGLTAADLRRAREGLSPIPQGPSPNPQMMKRQQVARDVASARGNLKQVENLPRYVTRDEGGGIRFN